MLEKNFVENSELLKVGEIQTSWPIVEDSSKEVALKGGLKIRYRERKFEGERLLDITFNVGRQWMTQSIVIETWPVGYGLRRYWQCQCGKSCSVLYLRSDSHPFACRECLNLKYNLSYLNRHTKVGKLLYRAHWANRAIELQERISRIDYQGKYTRKATRLMKISKKVGMKF